MPPAPTVRQRTGVPAHGCDDDELDDWLRRLTERTDPGMTWLGIVFALIVAAQLILPTGTNTGRVLAWVSWGIWAVFLIDFAVKLWIAPHRLRFLRTHWLSLLGLLLPALRFLSFLRLLRLGRALPAARVLTSTSRAARTTGRLFRSRVGYLGGLSSIAMLLIAELAYLFENGPHGSLPTFGAALIWSAATIIGMSPTVNPTSTGGQLTMIAGFVVGLVLVATLAGSIGAYLLSHHPQHHTDGKQEGQ